MHPLGADLHYAIRSLWRAKALTMTAIVTLALGIGGVTAMFSVVDAVLIRSVPVPRAGRLLVIWEGDPKDPSRISEVSHAIYRLWQEKSRSFTDVAAMGSVNWSFDLVGRGERRAVLQACSGRARNVRSAFLDSYRLESAGSSEARLLAVTER